MRILVLLGVVSCGANDSVVPTQPIQPPEETDPATVPSPSPVTVLGYPEIPAPDVDCAALPIGELLVAQNTIAPVGFDARADGWFWFAKDGVSEGPTYEAATLAYPGSSAPAIREDPSGVLWWADGGPWPALWRVEPGGAPVELWDGDVEEIDDLDPHPYGGVVMRRSFLEPNYVTFVDADGTVDDTSPGFPVQSVAYAADYRSLWMANGYELYTVPVEPSGRPNWTFGETYVTDIPALMPADFPELGVEVTTDLAVDACGQLYLYKRYNSVWGGDGGVWRYDPVLGTFTRLPGNVDQSSGQSPLRFGRIAGTETLLGTMGGGWRDPTRWLMWNVGAGAVAWP